MSVLSLSLYSPPTRLIQAKRAGLAVLLSLLVLGGCSSLGRVSTDELMEQGLALYNEGRYDESVLRFEEVLDREPGRYLAYLYIARSFMAQFKWDSAIGNARKALEISPSDGEVITGLAQGLLGGGMAALKGGDFSQAISHLSEFLRLSPSSVDGYVGLAQAYLGGKDYQQAAGTLINGLSSVQQGRGKLVQELLNGGVAALGSGQAQPAISMLGAYVKENPSDGNAYLNLARAYLQGGSILKALSTAQKAAQLNPDSTAASSLLNQLSSP